MKVTIEPTGETAELPNGQCGAVWAGRTEDGVPIVAVMASVGCPPEHRAAFERTLPRARRRTVRRCSWRDRLLGTPPMNCHARAAVSAQEMAADA
jgi:hypothetical protein